MKKAFVFVFLFVIGSIVMAQSTDRSQYEGTTLFDLVLWGKQNNGANTKKYAATVLFSMEGASTNLYFTDLDGSADTAFAVTKRWAKMNRGQKITIYFTATRSYGSLDTPTLDDIDYDGKTVSGVNSTPNSSISSIDRSVYTQTTLFDLVLWGKQNNGTNTKKYAATVLFSMEGASTNLYFTDLDGSADTAFAVTKRWAKMNRGQKITIYFTATRSYGSLDTPILDDIQF